MDIIGFGSDDIENKIAKMSAQQLDELPFGIIKLDAEGRVLQYNAAEGKIAHRNPKDALGRNFFTEVAPCTNAMGFRDRFDHGVKTGSLNVVFEWQFVGKNMPLVQVHMKSAADPNCFWLFIKRL